MSAILPEQQATTPATKTREWEAGSRSSTSAKLKSLAITPAAALVVSALSALFVYFSVRPLWHTDLWGHLAYGRLLFTTGALPATEPLMPLSEGVAFVDTAWLSQLLGFVTHNAMGAAGLQLLYAAGVTCCCSLLAWRMWRQTKSGPFVLISIGVFLAVGWQHLAIVRPQLAGLACFTSLFVLLTARRWSRINWVLVPLLFALWANLHGSFLVGIALLAAYCVGRGCDVLRRTDKFSAVVRDPDFRRYLLLTELAAVAVLLNPYGIGLYASVFDVAGNANLSDIVEWEPLTLRMKQGKVAGFVALVLVMLYRVSPRRVRVAEIVVLAGLGGAALWTSRMIIWWAPVAAYFLALHGNAAWKRFARRSSRTVTTRRPQLVWTVVALAVVATAVLAKMNEPAWRGGRGNIARARLSGATPVAAVAHLRTNPRPGQIFNSYEWGDYLLWAGPPQAPVFVASHAHFVPREVWLSYLQVVRLSANWEDILAAYGANTVLIEKQRRRALVTKLRENDDWYAEYEDDLAIIFRRAEPITIQ